LAAGEHMRQAIELHYRGQGRLNGTTEAKVAQEINWHHLRAARAKGDKAEVERRLADLLGPTPPENPDIANDLVPMLRDAGRAAEAKALFDKVYQALTDNPRLPLDHATTKNNLAWLCARCGERKEEALRLAQEATKLVPDNAAFLDTLA